MDDLGFCWACVVGKLIYSAMLDWYECDNCGYIEELHVVARMRRRP